MIVESHLIINNGSKRDSSLVGQGGDDHVLIARVFSHSRLPMGHVLAQMSIVSMESVSAHESNDRVISLPPKPPNTMYLQGNIDRTLYEEAYYFLMHYQYKST